MISHEEIERVCSLLVPRGCRHGGADMNALGDASSAVSAITALRAKELIELLGQDRISLEGRLAFACRALEQSVELCRGGNGDEAQRTAENALRALRRG